MEYPRQLIGYLAIEDILCSVARSVRLWPPSPRKTLHNLTGYATTETAHLKHTPPAAHTLRKIEN